MRYLDIQDATWKRRPISQTPEEWTESINISLEGVGFVITVYENNWNKAKEMIDKYLSQFVSSTAQP